MTAVIHCGDVRDVLATLPAGSVQTCVTSPPYYALRSYLKDTVQMSPNLTDDERAYVEAELARLGIAPTTQVV